MALFNPIEKNIEVLRGLHANRLKLEAKIAEAEGELDGLHAGQAEDASLDAFLADLPATATARIATLERQLADYRGARVALHRRVRAAITALASARAGVVHKQAKKPEQELAVHRAERKRLLDALQTFTEENFVSAPADGDVLIDATGGQTLLPREVPRIPVWRRLQDEIAKLQAEAIRIEQTAAHALQGGSAAATTVEEVLAVGDDVERLAPLRPAIERWIEAATAAAEAEFEAQVAAGRFREFGQPDSRTMRFILTWDADGEIDRSNSRATISATYSPRPAAEVQAAARTAAGYLWSR